MHTTQGRFSPDGLDLSKDHPIACFVDQLSKSSEVSICIDRPDDPKGEWWLDVTAGQLLTSVSWNPVSGFGIYLTSDAFGSRPDEVYVNGSLAANRLVQVAANLNEDGKPLASSLRDVRELLGISQTKVATVLATDQAAISRFEARPDQKLSTLSRYVQALGGRLNLYLTFPEFEVKLPVSSEQTPKSASVVGLQLANTRDFPPLQGEREAARPGIGPQHKNIVRLKAARHEETTAPARLRAPLAAAGQEASIDLTYGGSVVVEVEDDSGARWIKVRLRRSENTLMIRRECGSSRPLVRGTPTSDAYFALAEAGWVQVEVGSWVLTPEMITELFRWPASEAPPKQ